MNPLKIPYCFQLSWHSLSGYTAFRLQKSCLGNELNSIAKKIAAYVPRILIAFPLLMTCVALDLALLSIQTIITVPVLLFANICEFILECSILLSYLVDFISLIALPLVLAGYLLWGKIPESARSGESMIWGANREISQPSARHVIALGTSYEVERIFDHLELGQKEADASYDLYTLYGESGLAGSLLTSAVRSRSLEKVDLVIGKGATLQGMDKQARLNTLFYAFKGSPQMLKRILEFSDFDPTERFTVTSQHFQKWLPLGDVPIIFENLTNISLSEIAILSEGISGLKKLQTLGWSIDYVKLSGLQYFLNNPTTDPNTPLKTSIRRKGGNIEYFTEPAMLGIETHTATLEENPFYRAWIAGAQLNPYERNSETRELHKQNLREIMQHLTTTANTLSPYFSNDLIDIIMSY